MPDLRISELIQRTPNGAEYFEVIIPPFTPGTNRKVLLSDLVAGLGLEPYTWPFPQFTTATSTTAYTGTTAPAITAYATGQKFQVKAHATSTGASTLDLNGLGAKKVFTDPTTQATTGSLLINQVYLMVYDAALDGAVGGFLLIGSGGGAGWAVTGTTNLTGDAIVDNGVHNLLIGDLTGPYSSWDIDGSGPTGTPNSHTSGVGSGTHKTSITQNTDATSAGIALETAEDNTNEFAYITVYSGPAAGITASSSNEITINSESDVGIISGNDISITAGNTGSGKDIALLATNGKVTINGNVGVHVTSGSVAITDAATMDITSNKHTLTTSSATRTFTQSYAGDFASIIVTLNATASTFTFPSGALCVSEGVASGDNTAALAGVSGDKYYISISKYGTDYYVAIKNFGQ